MVRHFEHAVGSQMLCQGVGLEVARYVAVEERAEKHGVPDRVPGENGERRSILVRNLHLNLAGHPGQEQKDRRLVNFTLGPLVEPRALWRTACRSKDDVV